MNEEPRAVPEDPLLPGPPGPEMSHSTADDLPEANVRAVSDDAPGDTPPLPRVGRYQCEKKLNHRGMANVFEAYDTKLPARRAIIKIVKAEADKSMSASAQDALLHEARKTALAAEDHQDYFALVYDLGYDPDPGWAWFAMQKLSGETLREKLDARKNVVPAGPGIEVETACWLSMEVLKAVGILHTMGMLHGDVKPANVMWTTDGKVKLLDLGLAKFLHVFNENAVVVGGTPRYLAPEFYEANHQDGRLDLFAIGLLLYELLVGSLPADLGRGGMEAWRAHKGGCVPAAAQRAPIPAFCKEVIARAADPDPERRYQTAEQFREALDAGLTAWRGVNHEPLRPNGDLTTRGGRHGGRTGLALGLGAILLLGLGAIRFRGTPTALWRPTQQTGRPRVAAVAYRGECDIQVTSRDGADQAERPVLGGTIDSLQGDDRVYLTARLLDERAAFFYILQIDSRGRASALFPAGWAPGRLPPTESERADLRIPPVGDMPMDREASPGLEALICLVRPEPLTAEHNAVLWDLCTGKDFAWEQPRAFENVFVSFVDGEQTEHRGFDPSRSRVGKDPVSQAERILLTLKTRGVAAYSRAMCYPLLAPRAAGANPGKDQP